MAKGHKCRTSKGAGIDRVAKVSGVEQPEVLRRQTAKGAGIARCQVTN